ncbi:hypothetical protein [Paludisphaera mucosa]|uniref:DUF2330 domain-containing protein n=1 Tax=Paludisphaera mucosa TaxID=3030827 RepID=A0ABT6F436_9BACT|nr:hypothetical protein [Paludisphaera mucosa]MDG3002346.1 hypothetical protein [Paludisphaera mucosa]
MKLTVATLVILIACAASVAARAQEPTSSGGLTSADEERLRMLSDPEAIKKDAEKNKLRPPFEFYRSQVAPSDVLPWVKARHWHGMTVELRANLDDYEGSLQSTPVPIPETSWDVSFGREARLVKEQRSRLGMAILLPRTAGLKDLPVELIRTGAIRADQVYLAAVRPLAPQQMLALVLTKEANGGYAAWSRLNATIPASIDRSDTQAVDLLRYYRLILPLEPDKPLLPTHPLTWTAVSHIVWDGMEPDVISVSQQAALVDWLHWGGQLVVMGGAGPKFSVLRESFLDPYLPADSTGDGRALDGDDLRALADAYLPPPGIVAPAPAAVDASQAPSPFQRTPGPDEENVLRRRPSYDFPDPIRPEAGRPVQAAGLRARPRSVVVPIREGGEVPLAVERRVGRGRITMLAVNPTDPALTAWKGLDTLIRRVILRRPEESVVALGMTSGPIQPVRSMEGPDLSWYRIAARDVGAPSPAPEPGPESLQGRVAYSPPPPGGGQAVGIDYGIPAGEGALPNLAGVAEWRDEARIPRLCRDALEQSSGIKVPSSSFVLKVILAYVLAVAPLNWLICRVVLRRREAAWLVVPALALAFAVGVERVAAYDLGFDSAGDELDVLELQADHPRGHLSRFGSLYSTGHGRYTIRFPDDPTALALPFATGRSIAGEDRTTSAWRSFPVPALEDFTVQPRSLAMFRAEQMLALPGSIAIEGEAGKRTIRNGSGLELRDATLVEFLGPDEVRETYLGTIARDADFALEGVEPKRAPATVEGFDGPDPSMLLAALRRAGEGRPEDAGEVRLTAWTPGPAAGPRIEPALDRHRGATVVVAHLGYGPPPDPGGRHYDLTASRTP